MRQCAYQRESDGLADRRGAGRGSVGDVAAVTVAEGRMEGEHAGRRGRAQNRRRSRQRGEVERHRRTVALHLRQRTGVALVGQGVRDIAEAAEQKDGREGERHP